ncbi:MAG: RNA methyltransferase [Deltaproteobacteria bacterium]|nr:RNA methyltransferase [Deltaproteobacteria bacterium]
MGFNKLVVVRPSVLPMHPEARRLAVGAENLLKTAKVFETIEEATKGMHFLIGTSRRDGKYRQDFLSLPNLIDHLPLKQKIGILFGPEERGLSNQELAYCHLVTSIPSNPKFPSLNLAQSVMVVAYQLRLPSPTLSQKSSLPSPALGRGTNSEGKTIALATAEQIEGMYQHLEKMLGQIGFFPHRNSFHMMRAIRQVFGRTGLTEREVRIFRGMCRQVLWSIKETDSESSSAVPDQDRRRSSG